MCRQPPPALACQQLRPPLSRVDGHGHASPIALRVATSLLFIPLRNYFGAGARHRASSSRTRWVFDAVSYTAVSTAARARAALRLCSSASASGDAQAIAGFELYKYMSSYFYGDAYKDRGWARRILSQSTGEGFPSRPARWPCGLRVCPSSDRWIRGSNTFLSILILLTILTIHPHPHPPPSTLSLPAGCRMRPRARSRMIGRALVHDARAEHRASAQI